MKAASQQNISADLNRKIRFEILSSLAKLGRSSFAISLFNGGLTWYVLKDIAEQVVLLIWLGALVAITVFRGFLVYIFWHMNENSRQMDLWIVLYVLFAALSGLCWGWLPLMDVFFASNWSTTFIIFLVTGMSTGGMISLFPLMRAAVPYFILILAPLIYTLAVEADSSQQIMALFAALYCLFLIRSTYVLHKVAINSIRLEIENETLFDFLSEVRSGQWGDKNPVSSRQKKTEETPSKT